MCFLFIHEITHLFCAFFSFCLSFLPRFSTKCTEHTPRISNLFRIAGVTTSTALKWVTNLYSLASTSTFICRMLILLKKVGLHAKSICVFSYTFTFKCVWNSNLDALTDIKSKIEIRALSEWAQRPIQKQKLNVNELNLHNPLKESNKIPLNRRMMTNCSLIVHRKTSIQF